jgi:thiamine pyrophosphate-dependent acetolactate synthase large subunit-like protein
MLVIATALDVTDSAQGRGRLHEMLDQRGAAATVTNMHMRAYTPKDLRDAVARAFANFASRRPRPVYIEVPLDVLKQPAGEGWHARALPKMPVAEPGLIAAAIKKLNGAKRPAMILGGGALSASSEALAVAEVLQAPVFTTVAGKGAIPASHPLCMGYSLLNPETVEFIRTSDCILCVGSELSETDFWDTSVLIEQNLIRIDIDPDSLARPHTAEIAILGDAKAALAAIGNGLVEQRKPWAADAKAKHAGEHEDATLIKLLAAIRTALPAETIVCSDMTQIAYAANIMFPVERPHTWIHPVGFGTLGFGLPAGIGAKFGSGKTPVAVLHGDYGIQYTINELGTAVEHKLPVIILLWNNERLGAIHDSMANAGIQPNNVTLRNPDFQALARAYGCVAEKPVSLDALAIAIKAALKAEGPTLIEMTPRMVNG